MRQSILETAPAGLIPAAWIVAILAEFGYFSIRTLLIAHIIMCIFLSIFAITGWSQMDYGVLRIWRVVIAVGFIVTLISTLGLLWDEHAGMLATGLYGWMLLPGVALIYTGVEIDSRQELYLAGGLLSFLGAIVAGAVPSVAGIPPLVFGAILAGIGQTVAIADAATR